MQSNAFFTFADLVEADNPVLDFSVAGIFCFNFLQNLFFFFTARE